MCMSQLFISNQEKESDTNSDYEEINKEITRVLNAMDSQKEDTYDDSPLNNSEPFEENSFDSDLSFYINTSSKSAFLENNHNYSIASPKNFRNESPKHCKPSPMYQKEPKHFSSTGLGYIGFTQQFQTINCRQSSFFKQNSYPNPSNFPNQFHYTNQMNNSILTNNSSNDSSSGKIKKEQSHQIHKKKHYEIPKNKIHLEKILSLKEKRTTLMIRNIPNRFSLKQFVEELNQNFLNKFDVVYLPIDKENRCNLGFGFINFIDPLTIISFYDHFFGQKWVKFNSDKRCELAYAKMQGKEELKKYIERSVSNEEETAYVSNVSIISKAELPLKYLQAFLNFHPYSNYRMVGYNQFVLESLSNQ